MRRCFKKPNLIKNKFVSNFIAIIAIYIGASFYIPLKDMFDTINNFKGIEEINDYDKMLFSIFSFLVQSIGIIIGGILDYKIKLYYTTLIGILIVLISIIFIFFISNIYVLYIFGTIWGLGVGISISLLRKNLILFSPNNKGITNGIILMFNKLFYLAILNGLTKIIKKFSFYLLYGVFTVIIGSIIFFLFSFENKGIIEEKNNKEELGRLIELNENNENNRIEIEVSNKLNKMENELDKKDIKNYVINTIKSFRFWRLVLISMLLNFPFSLLSSTSSSIPNNLKSISLFAIFFGLLFPIFYFLTIPIIGLISDIKGHIFMLIIFSGLNIIPYILLNFLSNNMPLYYITYSINEFCYSGLYISFLPYIMEIYGIQESAILGGIFDIFLAISDIIRIIVVYIIKECNYKTGKYFMILKVLGISGTICCSISFVLLLFEYKMKIIIENKTKIDNFIS